MSTSEDSSDPNKSEQPPLPLWAKSLLTLFAAGVVIIVVAGTSLVWWLASTEKNMRDPNYISAALSQIADFEQPLPTGFKAEGGLEFGPLDNVKIVHMSDRQTYEIGRQPLLKGTSGQDLLDVESRRSDLKRITKRDTELVAGEPMTYFLADLKTGEEELVGVITPKTHPDKAIVIKVVNPTRISSDDNKILFSAIRGFGTHAQPNGTAAQSGNKTNNSH